jgi:Leucine-rich repeat (LRR) protein
MKNIQKVFELLESNDTANIPVGLSILENKPDWKASAEKRYLPFIQTRLNDNNATIFDFEKAALSNTEITFLLNENGKIGENYLSFDGIDETEVKLIVDTIGSVLAIVEDTHQLKKEMYAYTKKEFEETIESKLINIKFALENHLQEFGQTGWFGQIIDKTTRLGSGFLNRIYLDHTDFSSANQSLVLDYFSLGLVYLARFSNDLYIDIAQSHPPQFTSLFWLFQYLPRIGTLDCEIDLPVSSLSFTRTLKIRSSDHSNFKSYKSILPLKDPALTASLSIASKFLKKHGINKDIHKLTGLKKIQLIDTTINILPKEIGDVSQLKELFLRNTSLSALPNEIGKLKALKILFLPENKLTSLPETIENLPLLAHISIESNQVTTLPNNIGKLSNLKKLWCSDNHLEELPASILDCAKLEDLDLEKNNLTFLPEGFASFKKLKSLNLKGNPIAEDNDKMEALFAAFPKCKIYPLPPKKRACLLPLIQFIEEHKWHLPTEELTYMKELYATNTTSPILPKELGLLTQLTKLTLFENQIEVIPKEIGNLTALKELFISSNNIKELPVEIGLLKSLTILRLHENQLTTLPKEIGQLKKLHTLSLSHNPIEDIPEEIKNLKKLKCLKLRETPISNNRKQIKRLKELLPNCEILTTYE